MAAHIPRPRSPPPPAHAARILAQSRLLSPQTNAPANRRIKYAPVPMDSHAYSSEATMPHSELAGRPADAVLSPKRDIDFTAAAEVTASATVTPVVVGADEDMYMSYRIPIIALQAFEEGFTRSRAARLFELILR